ncbi:hypothetical protein HG536_0G00870 [Torulaspora globosa]|uniref:Uncharacterized protein n=1 Tax=Torulaspora globosa TaxID=48254 RepID=A0A7G3ZL44_9SACH|nr:uncharacterized protein HG536_0G00870 [Torulaspora globosa]QLL34230.1 hypothetical protein HG536_0G00870 [Torulaspora globosa]
MQGGIRRKRDLLPRYKNGGGRAKNGGVLTTPMKKIVVYVFLLGVVFVLLRLGFADLSKEVSYELDGAGAARSVVVESDGELRIPKETVPREQFNNEVAKQQEVKNLENDNKPPAPERNRRVVAKEGDKRAGRGGVL